MVIFNNSYHGITEKFDYRRLMRSKKLSCEKSSRRSSLGQNIKLKCSMTSNERFTLFCAVVAIECGPPACHFHSATSESIVFPSSSSQCSELIIVQLIELSKLDYVQMLFHFSAQIHELDCRLWLCAGGSALGLQLSRGDFPPHLPLAFRDPPNRSFYSLSSSGCWRSLRYL
jgi:hypothetical protein